MTSQSPRRPFVSSQILITFLLRAIALTLCIFMVADTVALAAGPADPATIKQTVQNRGIGKGLKVTETDGTVVVGTITSIAGDSFGITPKKTTQPTTVAYTQVSKLRNDGMSTGAKVGTGIVIGLVVAAAAVAITIAVLIHGKI